MLNKQSVPPPPPSTTTSASASDHAWTKFVDDHHCQACRKNKIDQCMVKTDRYQICEKWVKNKDCFTKPTPPNTACKRCFEGKFSFCCYPIVDDLCGKDWMKPTRLELLDFKNSKKPKDESFKSASGSLPCLDPPPPIASSSKSKGKARATKPLILSPLPPLPSTDFSTAAIVAVIEAQTKALGH